MIVSTSSLDGTFKRPRWGDNSLRGGPTFITKCGMKSNGCFASGRSARPRSLCLTTTTRADERGRRAGGESAQWLRNSCDPSAPKKIEPAPEQIRCRSDSRPRAKRVWPERGTVRGDFLVSAQDSMIDWSFAFSFPPVPRKHESDGLLSNRRNPLFQILTRNGRSKPATPASVFSADIGRSVKIVST